MKHYVVGHRDFEASDLLMTADSLDEAIEMLEEAEKNKEYMITLVNHEIHPDGRHTWDVIDPEMEEGDEPTAFIEITTINPEGE